MIQAKYRMYRLYKHYKKNRAAAITIQKAIRAYLATQRFLNRRRSRVNYFNVRNKQDVWREFY